MTTDKPNDDMAGQAGMPGDEGAVSRGDAAAIKPQTDTFDNRALPAEALGLGASTDEDAPEMGPPQLEDYVKRFVDAVRGKHGSIGNGAPPEADPPNGATADVLEDIIDIADFPPRGGVKRTRKVGRKYSVVSLVKQGLENGTLIELIESEVLAVIESHKVLEGYEVVFLYDHTLINRTHASAVYQRLLECDAAKNILLVLKSPGGQVEPAYLISKLCRRKSKSKFLVCVPGEAKSAATLLSLGADEIHMGAMSELGPIDPQINDFPALAFSSALDKIAQLAEKYPGASEMLAKYLIGSGMDVQALGHYDRIAESYSQYAINLLDSKLTDNSVGSVRDRKGSQELADYFTNHYKDHNFVIDVDEARKQLGVDMVLFESEIYQACHEIHKFLESCEIALTLQKKSQRISVLGNKFILRKS